MITEKQAAEIAKARLAHRRPTGECDFCDFHRDDPRMPSHTPSENCKSGKQPHCKCSICF